MSNDATPPTPDDVAGIRERHDATCWCLNDTHLAPMCDTARLLAAVDSLHSWRGLMALMDEHWPADIFPMGDEPTDDPDRDPGPRILALARWVTRLNARLDAVLAECDAADEENRTSHEPQDAGGWVWAYRIRRAVAGEGP